MENIMIIKEYSQLKALSDPFKSKLLIRLMETPQTGQQLSEIYKMPRAKVHYHLKELEKINLIKIVKTEEKNGIVQKFYQSVARGFFPDVNLLPYRNEISLTNRQTVLSLLDRTMHRVLSAPEESFEHIYNSSDPTQWNFQSSSWEITATEEHYKWLLKKQYELFEEFRKLRKRDDENRNAKVYYISNFSFEVEESLYEEKEEGE